MRTALVFLIILMFSSYAKAESDADQQYQLLQQDLQRLDNEAGDRGYGAIERLRFRQALEAYPEVRSREREQTLAMAMVLMQTADYAVKTGLLQSQLASLESERSAILVEASRRDAELARKEAERLRLAALAREEEESMAMEGVSGNIAVETASRLTEAQAKEKGVAVKVGRFPFKVNGKAIASGETEGFVKTVFDEKTGALIGAHMIGAEVTEMIQGYVLAITMEATEAELQATVYPHPTMSEAMHESALDAYGRVLHI